MNMYKFIFRFTQTKLRAQTQMPEMEMENTQKGIKTEYFII